MSRPRTATALLESRGSFEKHPERKEERANEPVPTGEIGKAPRYFDKDEKKIWKELVKVAPPNVLKNCDGFAVEVICILMARVRRRDPLKAGELNQLVTMLGRLGMTPSDRSKVHGSGKGKEADPWDAFDTKKPN